MKEISLNKNRFVIVDDRDYENLNQFRWCVDAQGYATRAIYNPDDQKSRRVLMHRVLMNTPNGYDTDHINGNKLDNRRCNLRIATRTQNIINVSKPNRHNKVGFRGVQMSKEGRFYSGLIVNGKRVHLGMFDTAEEASRAYQMAKSEAYKEFAPSV